MSSTAQPALQLRTANEFQFQDQSGQTNVTYYPVAPGPIVQGEGQGPLVKYSGPEGNFSFRGSQIETTELAMGRMICIDLTADNDTGSVMFNVCVPPVLIGNDGNPQTFSTYCVRAHRAGNVARPGAQITYENGGMQGTANLVFLPR